jgi:hypothetical protein
MNGLGAGPGGVGAISQHDFLGQRGSIRSKALLLCEWLRPDHIVCGGLASNAAGPGAFYRHLLRKSRLRFFPLAAAPVVGCVVAPTKEVTKDGWRPEPPRGWLT